MEIIQCKRRKMVAWAIQFVFGSIGKSDSASYRTMQAGNTSGAKEFQAVAKLTHMGNAIAGQPNNSLLCND